MGSTGEIPQVGLSLLSLTIREEEKEVGRANLTVMSQNYSQHVANNVPNCHCPYLFREVGMEKEEQEGVSPLVLHSSKSLPTPPHLGRYIYRLLTGLIFSSGVQSVGQSKNMSYG